MNTPSILVGLLAFAVLQWSGSSARAQTYSIDWHSIDGGGGTSTGGGYSVSGTIGQPDASQPISGGPYSFTGGYWALHTVQTPGVPRLTIVLTGTNTVVVSWPSPSTGFGLEETANLDTPNWVSPSEPVSDDGTRKFIVVKPSAGDRFYRLRSGVLRDSGSGSELSRGVGER